MVKYKGRLGFKKYMPLKPVKRGIKIWVLANLTRKKVASLNMASDIVLLWTLLAILQGKN